ncbi:MAG: hypothetical protein ACI31P_07015, partial [Ligilactobacillus ruminis]
DRLLFLVVFLRFLLLFLHVYCKRWIGLIWQFWHFFLSERFSRHLFGFCMTFFKKTELWGGIFNDYVKKRFKKI